MKHNIIFHITTSCNYDCSYCDVVKDGKIISSEVQKNVCNFIEKNSDQIERWKFFWGEPLIAFNKIKPIIKKTNLYIQNNYEIVTNTTLLQDEVWEYFSQYFSLLFFSIDSENTFDYTKVLSFVEQYQIEKRLYFNIIISPWSENIAKQQFQKLYDGWMRGFNILPVYFTQPWTKKNLKDLSDTMRYVLDTSIVDNSLRLYGFQENKGYDTSLANNTIFIDVDGSLYYSDIASTFSGKKIKEHLYLWDIKTFDLQSLDGYNFWKEKEQISIFEENIYTSVSGQRELHKLMDYFSHYLNNKR